MKKKVQKGLSWLLTLCMMFTLQPMVAQAANELNGIGVTARTSSTNGDKIIVGTVTGSGGDYAVTVTGSGEMETVTGNPGEVATQGKWFGLQLAPGGVTDITTLQYKTGTQPTFMDLTEADVEEAGKAGEIVLWINGSSAGTSTIWMKNKGGDDTTAIKLSVTFVPYVPLAGRTPEEILRDMTLDQKIGQKIMPDFRQWKVEGATAVSDVTAINSEIIDIIDKYDFGGVILFANNVKETEQTLRLTTQLQQAALKDEGKEAGVPAIPMFLTIDQEGGIVYRLGSGTALPGNMAIGATRSTEMAKQVGEIIGSELSALGFNVNFAPVVDVNNNPENPVIGLRSISSDPNLVAGLSVPMIEGMNEYNVASAAKHFPGHGNTATDSHYGLPIVDRSFDELKATELVPFKAAVDAGVDMLMTAHIEYPQIDSTNAPATLSKTILQKLAREYLGYDGVIITDALNMDAIAKYYGQADAVVKCFEAGVDIALMPIIPRDKVNAPKDMDAVIAAVKSAINDGRLTMEQIDKSVLRILTLKENRGILDAEYPAENSAEFNAKLATAKEEVGSQQNRKLEREIAAAAITVVKNENNLLPLKPKAGEKVLLFTPYANEEPGLQLGMRRAIADGAIPTGVVYETNRTQFASGFTALNDAVKAKIDEANYIVIISEATATQLAGWQCKFPQAVTAYAKGKGIPAIVVSISQPYDVANYPDASAILAAYGAKGMDPTESLQPDKAFGPNIPAAVEVIFGNYQAKGKLPVNIPVIKDGKVDISQNAYSFGFGLTLTYTVAFESNGGTAVDTAKVEVKAQVIKPADPTKSGYVFAGWYTDTELTASYDFNEPVTKNLDLYAKWTEVPVETTYTLTFHTDGGSVVDAATVKEGEMVEKPADPTKSGFTFAGWYTDTELTAVYDFNAPVTKNLDLYAKWTENPVEITYTVTFHTDGGSTVDVATVKEGETAAKPADPTKSDYTFAGWYTDTELTDAYDFNAPVTKNLDLYAKWNPVDTPYVPSTSGNTKTETRKNEDGSTTKIVTNKITGMVTETTTWPNGAKLIVVTKKDGTVTTTATDSTGLKTETITTPAGNTTANVTLPKGMESAKVTVPVKKATSGTVAILVHNDGTEEIIRTSVNTGDGIQITVNGNAKIKIIDNTKIFTDVKDGDWFSAAVQFAASRELFTGTGTGTFSPLVPMSRAMLVTVLARMDGQDIDGGATWYEKAVKWGVKKGITDGNNLETSITRESLVTMLFRYADAKPVSDMELNKFPDADQVSDWASDAMNWAVANGILTGTNNGRLNPSGTASRAEVAAILQRFVSQK